MAKIAVTENEYISELNTQLRKHEFYEEGMIFTAHPVGATGKNILGYSVQGPLSKIGVFADTAHIVSKKYEIKI